MHPQIQRRKVSMAFEEKTNLQIEIHLKDVLMLQRIESLFIIKF